MKNNKLSIITIGSALLGTWALFGMVSEKVYADETHQNDAVENIEINAENFPDEGLRKLVADFDLDKDGFLSRKERDKVVSFSVECTVYSLKGIEYFTNIEELYYSDYYSELTEIDLSKNIKLKSLVIYGAKIESLDLSKHTKLESLIIQETLLRELALDGNKSIKTIECMYNKLSEIDLSECECLESLDCTHNHLRSVNLKGCSQLKKLFCGSNRLTDLDISSCLQLEDLNCGSNRLESLDLSKNLNLTSLLCQLNLLRSLTVQNLPNLEYVDVSDNMYLQLNFQGCKALSYLNCSISNLEELDVSTNVHLKHLEADWTNLKALNLSNNTELEELYVSGCRLKHLDISSCTTLVKWYNDPKTQYEDDGSVMYFYNSDYLLFLRIDNYIELETETLQIDDNNFPDDVFRSYVLENIDLDQNGRLSFEERSQVTKIDLNGQKVQNLRGIEYFWGLTTLLCNETNGSGMLYYMDISHNEEIRVLECSMQRLTFLELGLNTELQKLILHGNFLKYINISFCTDLVSQLENDQIDIEIENDHIFYKNGDEVIFSIDKGVEVEGLPPKIMPSPTPTPVLTPTPTPTPSPVPEIGIGSFVERLYTQALGRKAEEKGKQYWVEEITAGRKSGGDCGLFFLTGEEFVDRKLSDEVFVEVLYKTFFDRESEETGKAYWLEVLEKGGARVDVIAGFIDSKEWCNLCADYGVRSGAPSAKAERPSKNALSFANRLYTCCLKRDPEEKGLQYWALALTNLEKTGAQAASEFFNSEEFKGFSTSDEEYVTRLYKTFMDREPEAEGGAYWVGQLKSGVSRSDVLSKFVVSKEFTEICAGYGIERGTV